MHSYCRLCEAHETSAASAPSSAGEFCGVGVDECCCVDDGGECCGRDADGDDLPGWVLMVSEQVLDLQRVLVLAKLVPAKPVMAKLVMAMSLLVELVLGELVLAELVPV